MKVHGKLTAAVGSATTPYHLNSEPGKRLSF